MQKLQLSKTVISSLPFCEKTTIYTDQEVHWLQLWVRKKSKVFYATRWLGKRPIKVKIGDATLINPAIARKKALEICTKIAAGEDPRERRYANVTLATVWADYQKFRQLRPGTLRTYSGVLENHYAHLMSRDILKITEHDIAEVHLKLGRAGQEQYANVVSRVLRSLMNFAMAQYREGGKPLLSENPTNYLTRMKLWYRPKRRKGRLAANQVSQWLQQVGTLENKAMADCMELILLTGLRLNEALKLRWDSVDMETRMFTVPGDVAKNHDDHTLPMTDRIYGIFQRRLAEQKCEFVFKGHLKNQPLKSLAFGQRQIEGETGIKITTHDLRRTFITAAESLDISKYALKRLLNHRDQDDVTGGYIIWNPIRLLQPLKEIEARLLSGDAHSW
jgi:integrase